jgi:hypothetical protein
VISPTARTLQYCRKMGWRIQVVERWNQYAGIRIDLFGFIDLIALTPDNVCLGIQATSSANMSARVTKSTVEKEAELQHWLACGNQYEVWGWAKRGPAGKRKLWTLRRVAITDNNGFNIEVLEP